MPEQFLWIASDERGVHLFYKERPEWINGKWIIPKGALGRLPEQDFPPEQYRVPRRFLITEIQD